MVSVSIIVILSTVFLINYNSYRKSGALNMGSQQVVSSIRLVQNYALASQMKGGVIPAGGWGVYFDNSAANASNGIPYNQQIIIYADEDGDSIFDDPAEYWDFVKLPDNIFVANLNYPTNVNTTDFSDLLKICPRTSLTYLPPQPQISFLFGICGLGAEDNPKIISLDLRDADGNEKTIRFNKFGLIDPM